MTNEELLDPENIAKLGDIVSFLMISAVFFRTGRLQRIAKDVAGIRLKYEQLQLVGLEDHSDESQIEENDTTEEDNATMLEFEINGTEYEITNKQFACLIKSEALILDADDETYVLNPQHTYTHTEVVMLICGENAP